MSSSLTPAPIWSRIVEDNTDTLALDESLWGGGLTATEVVNTYATVVGGDIVLDFGGGNVLTVEAMSGGDYSDATVLINDITLV